MLAQALARDGAVGGKIGRLWSEWQRRAKAAGTGSSQWKGGDSDRDSDWSCNWNWKLEGG